MDAPSQVKRTVIPTPVGCDAIMPGVGHLAVGLAGARVSRVPQGVATFVWTGGLVIASYLPDADVLAFRFGIPYPAPFGHRGAFHSLASAGIESGPDGGYISMRVMWMRSQRRSVLSRKLRLSWHKRLTPARACRYS
jgi:hypothetical protein